MEFGLMKEYTSFDRVAADLEHKEPDRVSAGFWRGRSCLNQYSYYAQIAQASVNERRCST